MAETLDLSTFVQYEGGTAHLELAVEGVTCASCIGKIEGSLKRLPGIVAARLNFTNRRLAVDWRGDGLWAPAGIRALDGHGHPAAPVRPERPESRGRPQAAR